MTVARFLTPYIHQRPVWILVAWTLVMAVPAAIPFFLPHNPSAMAPPEVILSNDDPMIANDNFFESARRCTCPCARWGACGDGPTALEVVTGPSLHRGTALRNAHFQALSLESYAAFIFVSDDCRAARLNSSAHMVDRRGVLSSTELLALQEIHEMVRPFAEGRSSSDGAFGAPLALPWSWRRVLSQAIRTVVCCFPRILVYLLGLFTLRYCG
jgi:hypothetical protein